VRTQTVTILFCDLVASTERRARLGDDDFDAFTERFVAALRGAIEEHGGREVKSAGDGLMVVFPSAADAVTCAIDMHRTMVPLDLDDPPKLRIGISCGEVAVDDSDYSGMPIVEAARLEALAQPGQTLANAIVRSLVGTRRALRFRDAGVRTLKGIPEPLATVEVIDEEPEAVPSVVPRPKKPRLLQPLILGAAVLAVIVAAAALVVIRRESNDAKGSATSPTGTEARKYTPKYTKVACPPEVSSVASDATCGELVVPENRDKPHGNKVQLLVTRVPPRRSGPVVVPTIDICGCENPTSSLARDHSELIHVGQRGYEGKPTLVCPEFVSARLAAFSRRTNDAAANATTINALRTCHDRWTKKGVDLSQYNFDTAAQDVIDLMSVLHIKQANLVALFEIAAEAFAILRHAPGVVRTMTLDNPQPPGETFKSDPIHDLARAFGRFVAFCRADANCGPRHPNLAEQWKAAYEKANDQPTLLSAPNPFEESGAAISVLLDGPRTADALATGLYHPEAYGAIAGAINSPPTAVEANAVLENDRLVPEAPWGAQASYFCAYDVHTMNVQSRELAARELPQFVRGHDTQWPEWCTGWDVPEVESLGADIAGDVPILAFRADLAPEGSRGALTRIQRGFPAMQIAVFPTLSGDLLQHGPPCLGDLRRAFLQDPAKKLDISACEKQSPPIDFLAG
jgi:class 3 adenylate cyclase/pimeloyl-ACP methyl ester carboxylesterase